MKKHISTLNLSYEEWIAHRKSGIGGSDAGAICGLNPYASPMSVYYDKTSEGADGYDNEAMRQGRDLEDYVARRFMEETGLKVRRSNSMYWSDEHPFMFANVDRLVVGEKAGLECKTASAYSADKWKDGEIPAHYEIQCHHYMAVTGADAWYIAVLILGKEFKYRKIMRDEGIIRNLVMIECDFWNNHVLSRTIPDPDGSEVCDEVIRKYYPYADQTPVILPDSFNTKLERRQELAGLIDRMQAEQRQIEQEIKLYMQGSGLAENSRYRVSWKDVESARLDTKRLKQEAPEIYQDYINISQSRRFSVKAA